MLFMERKAPDLDLKKTDLGGQNPQDHKNTWK